MPKPTDLRSEPMPVACFAPALTDETLSRYKELALSTTGELRDGLDRLLHCVGEWWRLPESKSDPSHLKLAIRHRGKDIQVPLTPLEDRHVKSLDAVTPWPRELEAYSNDRGTGLFDDLPAGDLRNAAFHLLWHVKELALDREPVTQDKLS